MILTEINTYDKSISGRSYFMLDHVIKMLSS